MLSGLLKNDIAIQVSINIMNAFVEMRKDLGEKCFGINKIESLDIIEKIIYLYN